MLVICGGESAERNVSVVSAKMIYNSLDPLKYEKDLIWISKKGRWIKKDFNFIDKFENSSKSRANSSLELFSREISPAGVSWEAFPLPDVIFPVLHGPLGEDGTLQGFLELLHVPYVGCGVLGSALGMDKEFSKILAKKNGIPVLPFLCLRHPKEASLVEKRLRFPVFVKPARLGSSVGISRVENSADLSRAIRLAFSYDTKILIEKAISPREIECAVLGDPDSSAGDLRLRASVLGEVIPHSDFYDYKTKYLTANGAGREIPAKLNSAQTKKIREYSIQIFRALECYGMARVDFLVDKKTQKIYFNEINTIPGFTPTSMYPALWRASGIEISRLLDILIKLALFRGSRVRRLSSAPAA